MGSLYLIGPCLTWNSLQLSVEAKFIEVHIAHPSYIYIKKKECVSCLILRSISYSPLGLAWCRWSVNRKETKGMEMNKEPRGKPGPPKPCALVTGKAQIDLSLSLPAASHKQGDPVQFIESLDVKQASNSAKVFSTQLGYVG